MIIYLGEGRIGKQKRNDTGTGICGGEEGENLRAVAERGEKVGDHIVPCEQEEVQAARRRDGDGEAIAEGETANALYSERATQGTMI